LSFGSGLLFGSLSHSLYQIKSFYFRQQSPYTSMQQTSRQKQTEHINTQKSQKNLLIIQNA